MQIYGVNRMMMRCFAFVAIINVVVTTVSLLLLDEDGIAGAAVASQQLSGTISIYGFLGCIYGCAKTDGAARVFSAVLLICFGIVLQVENGAVFAGLSFLAFAGLISAGLIICVFAWSQQVMFLKGVEEIRTYLLSRSALVLIVATLVYLSGKWAALFVRNSLSLSADLILKQAVLLSVMTLFIYSASPYLKRTD